MEESIISRPFLEPNAKRNKTKPPKLKSNTDDNQTKHFTITDMIDKETCSQSAQNPPTINLTGVFGDDILTQNRYLKQKTQRPQNTSEIHSYYRKAKKLKIDALLNEKTILNDYIASMKKKSMILIIDVIPSNLEDLKDIIFPLNIVLNSTEGCQTYTDYLISQIETLNDIYLFKETVDNRDVYVQQYSLYCFLTKVLAFVDKLKNYYIFLSKLA